MKKNRKLFMLTAVLIAVCLIPSTLIGKETVEELKERIIEIQNKGKLGFRNFTRCENILSYGSYVEAPDNKITAGSQLLFYYEPENIFTNRRKGTFQVWYTQDLIVKDAEGNELLNSPDLLNFNYQTISPVLDLYATNSLDLGDLPPGKYEFIAVINDKLKKTSARISYVFEIVPAEKDEAVSGKQ
ncbi:MAG: hypothetical protein U9R36_07140 [Elusimicrobiota bacterium]|nr:hypothetical protein [Elusimicrobiota bacterium]